MPQATPNRPLGFAACALASSLWGCGFFFGKIALAEMNVGAMVFYRFLFGTLVLIPLLFTHKPRFSRGEWKILLIASFLGIPVQFLLQFYGLSRTTVSHASLMVGTLPVILAVGAAIYAHERMDRIGWIALACSTTGATLIALGRKPTHSQATLAGDLIVVLSIAISLAWILMNKRLLASSSERDTHSPIAVTAYGLLLGTLMLIPIVPPIWGLPPIHGISLKAWLALIASGVLCTATTTLLWNWGLTQVPASQAGVLLNMEPLLGSLLGVVILKESLGPTAWVGGLMILTAAITLTTRSNTHVSLPVTQTSAQ